MEKMSRHYQRYEPGMRFGKLTLLERIPGGQKWRCQCDCGNIVITQISQGSRQCMSCAKEQPRNIKHGHNRMGNPDRIYRIWVGMKSRCLNPNDTGYHCYGGRGINICEEWCHDGYQDDLTIDRIDVNGDYTPDNCSWSTRLEQARNRRATSYKYGRDNLGRFKSKEESSI